LAGDATHDAGDRRPVARLNDLDTMPIVFSSE
jgi:hypothetical protein